MIVSKGILSVTFVAAGVVQHGHCQYVRVNELHTAYIFEEYFFNEYSEQLSPARQFVSVIS